MGGVDGVGGTSVSNHMSASLGLVDDAEFSALPRARASDGTNGR